MFNWFRQSSKSAPRIVPRAVAFQAVVPEAKPLTPAPLNVPADVLAQLSLQAQRILLRMPAETRPLHCWPAGTAPPPSAASSQSC